MTARPPSDLPVLRTETVVCPYCAGRKGRYMMVASRFTGTDCHMHEGPWETCWACDGTGEMPKCLTCGGWPNFEGYKGDRCECPA